MLTPTEELMAYIEESKFFSVLSKEQILHFLSQFEIIQLNPRDMLFYQGDASDFVYILIRGNLISFSRKPSGKIIVGSINPIQTIGELGALSGEPRSLTVEAVSKAELLKLPTSVFRQICEDYPVILSEVSQLIVQRTSETIHLMAHEKLSHNVSIVVSLVKTISLDVIKARFRKHLEDYNNTVFLASDEIKADELKNIIKKSLQEKKQIIIFMESWHENIYRYCFQELTHLYFLVSTNQVDTINHQITDIQNQMYSTTSVRTELILIHPDHTKYIKNSRPWLELADFDLHHHVRLNNDVDFSRLTRFMTGNAFTLVLGGGGAKGYVHLGVLRALAERNIPIDAIGGTSVGANVGACFATTQFWFHTMEYVSRTRDAALKSLKMSSLTWPLVSVFSSEPVTKELNRLFKNQCIEDLFIPYFAVSSNLNDKMQHIHRSGSIWEAIRSSASLPGLFPPVVVNGKLLFDGGLLNNLPVDVMRDLIGPGHMIMAVSLSQNVRELDQYNFPPVLTRKQTILNRMGWDHKDYKFPFFPEMFLNALLLGSSATEQINCSSADLLIKPDLAGYTKLADKGDMLIEIGYLEAKSAISKFLQLHPHFKRN